MKGCMRSMYLLFASMFFLSCSFVSSAIAHENVVVIPLSSGSAPDTIVTNASGISWFPHNTGPTTVSRYVSFLRVSGDGGMVLGVNAPTSIDNVEYGLASFELCIDVASSGYLNTITMYRTESDLSSPLIFFDNTDRTTDGCYTYTVNEKTNYGVGIYIQFAGGGTVQIEGARFTWKKSETMSPSPMPDEPRNGSENG